MLLVLVVACALVFAMAYRVRSVVPWLAAVLVLVVGVPLAVLVLVLGMASL